MSRAQDLAKNTLILSIGKFLPKVTGFITLPILTAFLSTAEYGAYDLISTLIMLVLPVATLQIQSAAFRFLIECRSDQEKSTEIISSIFVVTIPIAVIASFLVQFFFREYSILLRMCISAYMLFDTLQLTTGQVVRGLGHNKSFTVASCITSITNMFGVVIGVYFWRGGLLSVLMALAVAEAAATVYMLVTTQLLSYFDFTRISRAKIVEMLKYSWPMVPNNLSNWVLRLSDRLVITAVLGIEANAVYAVANKLPSLLSMAQTGFTMAWYENASIAAKDKDATKYYSSMFAAMHNLMFGCTALLVAATPILFTILIRGDYADAYYQMPILILAMFFFTMSSFLGGIYIAEKKTASVGITTMIAAIINLCIDVCTVRMIGIWAGSISTLCAYAFLFYFRLIECQKFRPITVKITKHFLELAILVVMLAMCFQKQTTLDLLNMVMGIAAFVICNRSMIVMILRKVSRKKVIDK